MKIQGKIRISLSSYFCNKRADTMTEEERNEIAESYKKQGAKEVEFY